MTRELFLIAAAALCWGVAPAFLRVEWLTARRIDADTLALSYACGSLAEAALTALCIALSGELYFDVYGLLGGLLSGASLLLWTRAVVVGRAGIALPSLFVAAGATLGATAMHVAFNGGGVSAQHALGLFLACAGAGIAAVAAATPHDEDECDEDDDDTGQADAARPRSSDGGAGAALSEAAEEQATAAEQPGGGAPPLQAHPRPLGSAGLAGLLLGLQAAPHVFSWWRWRPHGAPAPAPAAWQWWPASAAYCYVVAMAIGQFWLVMMWAVGRSLLGHPPPKPAPPPGAPPAPGTELGAGWSERRVLLVTALGGGGLMQLGATAQQLLLHAYGLDALPASATTTLQAAVGVAAGVLVLGEQRRGARLALIVAGTGVLVFGGAMAAAAGLG